MVALQATVSALEARLAAVEISGGASKSCMCKRKNPWAYFVGNTHCSVIFSFIYPSTAPAAPVKESAAEEPAADDGVCVCVFASTA